MYWLNRALFSFVYTRLFLLRVGCLIYLNCEFQGGYMPPARLKISPRVLLTTSNLSLIAFISSSCVLIILSISRYVSSGFSCEKRGTLCSPFFSRLICFLNSSLTLPKVGVPGIVGYFGTGVLAFEGVDLVIVPAIYNYLCLFL